ncbi:ribonuclease H-like domain-containing protein [Tanacetum coccineum]
MKNWLSQSKRLLKGSLKTIKVAELLLIKLIKVEISRIEVFGYILQDYKMLTLKKHEGYQEVNKARGLGSTSGIRACAFRNFDLEDMEFESAQSNTTAKLPLLKLVTKNSVPETAEEKINKKNDVKARSLLLMALPNEHLLTFSQYSDAKTLYAAIKTRFGGNEATKKTQKALLKQQYENFNASNLESLDSIFNILQKIVSMLTILCVLITLKDLNSKFLRSLPPEWNTHVVVWMNKDDIETMSMDDLYNNFKIVEQEVKKSVDVSTVSTNVNTTSPKDSTASLSDAIVYAFLANQPNGSQLVHENLEQIHDDDLEEIDLKWQLALLIECFNCHKMGHFARECRNPRNQDSKPRNHDTWNRNQDSIRKTVNVEETFSKAMLAIDGIGFDWSDMAEEQVQTNMALMAFSDSKVYTDKSCSKTCLKNYEALKKHCDDLIVKLNETEFKAATYKRGLATVEDQLVTFKKNEVLFSEEIVVLKREVGCKDYEISVLKTEYEKVKQEKEGIDFKIAKFDKSAKSLGELLESQVTNKSKKGLGYNTISPPHPLIYNRQTKLDLSYSGLDEFKEPAFNGYGPRDTVLKSTIDCDKESSNSKENTDDSLEKEQVTDNESSSVESLLKFDKETVIDWKETFFHTAKIVECVKPKNNEKTVKNQLGMLRCIDHKVLEGIREIGMINYPNHQTKKRVTGNNYNRVDYDYYSKTSHPSSYGNMTPRAVLLKSGLKPLSTARPVYTAQLKPIVQSARPMTYFSKQAQSTVQMPFYKKTTLTNRYFNQKVNTARPRVVNTARPYRAPVNTIMENGFNAINDKGFVDSGCLRHMTGNIAYLIYFKEFNGGRDTKVPQSGGPLKKVGNEPAHKELGDRMERAATIASSLEAEQDSAAASTRGNGEVELTATIDGYTITLTEAFLRRHLKLEDNGGVSTLINLDIFEQLALMGYYTDSDKLTFQKGNFSPQWRFLIHTILHCLSPKKTAWEQFSSNIATAIICLATNRTYNFLKMIFDAMVKNVDSTHKFLMYPRCDEGSLSLNELTVLYISLSKKIKGLESELKQTKQTYNVALTKLIKRVKKLEQILKTSKARRRAKIVLSEDEDVAEDSSKQGRKISDINEDLNISLVQDEGMTWSQEDAKCSGEKDEREVSTVGLPISTPTITPDVSTASERGSAAGIKAKDKGKGIMQESMPSKKIKKRVQIQMTVDDELAKKLDSIDWNIVAEQLQERQSDTIKRYQTLKKKPISVAQARKNMMIYLRNIAGYKMDYFKGMIYDDIRPIFEVEYNKVQTLFKNRDVEEEKGQKVLEESAEKTETEQVKIESSKKDGGTRKKSFARKRARETLIEENAKKQKLEDNDEKEELQGYLNIMLEDEGLDVESLATKYPIVDWETCYYQIKRVDGSVKHYNLFSVMLYDFDRQDVQELYKLVKERFQTRSPEGYDLLL